MKEYPTRNNMMKDILKPGMVVCEVGVFMGEFSRFLHSLEPSELVLIDPFEGWCSSGDVNGANVINTYLPMVYEYMRADFKRDLGITVERGLSWDVLQKYPDNYFDAIYIDSSHSYEGTKRELELCRKKVKRGGYISGHDYLIIPEKCPHKYEFGVKKAVDEFCTNNNLQISALALDGCASFLIVND